MLVVVVLPCAPATAIVRFSDVSSREQLGARHHPQPALARRASSGLSAGTAVE